MNVMVPIPDALAARFGSSAELGRRAVEALALAEYLAGGLTGSELRQSLGFATDGELVGFLKRHGLGEAAKNDEDAREMQNLDGTATEDSVVARFQAFAAGHMLGFDIKSLISEGRR